MRAGRRSAAKETMFLRRRKEAGGEMEEEEEEKSVAVEEEFGWKCWKHPLHHPPHGVCAACLRDRLLRLCPECASVRPCPCFPSAYSSGSSSSSSAGSREGADEEAGVGAVGLISRLIESEPAFYRSRSVGLELLRSTSVAASAGVEEASAQLRPRGSGKGWGLPWPFSWVGSGRKESADAETGLFRSRSVAVGRSSVAGGCAEPGEKVKEGRRWHFPSPMKVFPSPMRVFRHLKPATKAAAQERSRSPLRNG